MDKLLKFVAANAIELGWQGTRLNVLYGFLRGGHCSSQVHIGVSCSQAIAAACRNPEFSIRDVLNAANDQFGKCRDYANTGCDSLGKHINANSPGDHMFNASLCCRETSKGSCWG